MAPLDELEPAVRAGSALSGPALVGPVLVAGSVPRNEDQEPVAGELELVEVLAAAEPDGQLPVELVTDEAELERRDVVIARGMRWHQVVVGAQVCFPGSTKGRPGNRSWIESVWT